MTIVTADLIMPIPNAALLKLNTDELVSKIETIPAGKKDLWLPRTVVMCSYGTASGDGAGLKA